MEKRKREAMRAMKAEAEDDLLAFVRMIWPILEPSKELVEGWALDLLCEVFMSVADGQLTRVCLNVPPGSMKSTLLNVCLPARVPRVCWRVRGSRIPSFFPYHI